MILLTVFLSAVLTAEEQKTQIEYYKFPIKIDGNGIVPSELTIGSQVKTGTPVAMKDLQDNNDEMIKIFKDYFKAFENKSFEGFPYQIKPPMPAIEEDKFMPGNMKNWIYLNYSSSRGQARISLIFIVKHGIHD